MNTRNMTLEERLSEAERSNNVLALAIAEELENQLEELKEAQADILDDIASDAAKTIETQIESEIEESELNADSDYADSIIDCLAYEFTGDNIRGAANDLLNRDSCLDDKDRAALDSLILDAEKAERYADYLLNNGTYKVRVVGNYYGFPGCFASACYGEFERELSHYLTHYSEELQPLIRKKLTGTKEGELFYYNASDSSLQLLLQVEELKNWLETDQEASK